MVERITGIPKDQFLKAADLFTSIRKDGDMKKVATIMYAVGWTQHTFGTQIIRTAAMLQLLLGNVGRAGGGVNALRGHSNIQGATDMGGVFDILPGYLKVPVPADTSLKAYLERTTPTASKPANWESFNYWSNTPRFAVSLLKAMFGDAATKENDFAFDYMPKVDRNYSWTQLWDQMYRGTVKGLFAFGMNGVAIGPDSQKNIEALKKADCLVVGEIYPDETSEFWNSPGITQAEKKDIKTTVYRLPCAGFAEKDGSHDQLGALAAMEKHRRAAARRCAPRPGHHRADFPEGARALSEGRRQVSRPDPEPDVGIYRSAASRRSRKWPRSSTARRWPMSPIRKRRQVDQGRPAIAGLCMAAGRRHDVLRQLDLFRMLDRGRSPVQRRGTEDPSGLGVYPNWAWSWPANRRVLYNRASCDPAGKPWDAYAQAGLVERGDAAVGGKRRA